MTQGTKIVGDVFCLECYDEYFAVFLALLYKHLEYNTTDVSLSEKDLGQTLSKNILSNEHEFNKKFGEEYLLVRRLLRNAFAAFRGDTKVNHYETMNDIRENLDSYLPLFKQKFYAWFIFLNDSEMNEIYIYDDLITKIIKYIEPHKDLFKIKLFLSNPSTRDKLREHDQSIESLIRYTDIIPVGKPNDKKRPNAKLLSDRPGYEEFDEFINDPNNLKILGHDDSFECLKEFINMLNDEIFEFTQISLKEYLKKSYTQAMNQYSETFLSKQPLSP